MQAAVAEQPGLFLGVVTVERIDRHAAQSAGGWVDAPERPGRSGRGLHPQAGVERVGRNEAETLPLQGRVTPGEGDLIAPIRAEAGDVLEVAPEAGGGSNELAPVLRPAVAQARETLPPGDRGVAVRRRQSAQRGRDERIAQRYRRLELGAREVAAGLERV